ncbi:MAG: hypothetical protein JXB62_06930 [Pirellulales bacterium]|nr:hypothetical protein [Pirellulales bacterium]
MICALHPEHKDKCVYYCYHGPRIRYIISAFKADSPAATAFHRADHTVGCLRRRISDPSITRRMLHPFWCFEQDGQLFVVDSYLRPALRFAVGPVRRTTFDRFVSESSRWILAFQRHTLAKDPACDAYAAFSKRLGTWMRRHKQRLPAGFHELRQTVLAQWRTLATGLPHAARHGDYAFPNYFFTREGHLHVFDWEYSAEEDSVACDFFLNLVAYAIYLKATSRSLRSFSDLFGAEGRANGYMRSLRRAIRTFENTYGIGGAESRLLFVYAYFCLLMNCRTNHTVAQRLDAIPDLHRVMQPSGER